MNYSIAIAESAEADLRESTQWIRDEASPAADQWLAGLLKTAESFSQTDCKHGCKKSLAFV